MKTRAKKTVTNASEKVRDYLTVKPDADASEISKALKLTPKQVYGPLCTFRKTKVTNPIIIKIIKDNGVEFELKGKEVDISLSNGETKILLN